ncbi:MFS transporter [Nonomuraea wenchangensis]|uniref:Predicted arabinose efflux permease, MFS family n=1 Tax=Nonomuraea wenchangensis TaxID=568860 RepID=A0A1I0A1L6_9ACTN|nr:MFS transporter [Nonomuraea wenchangensis]SES87985.1 Predicted arabinose efflux permease, MFS family [Nonomuraea wenchangensis]
MALDPYRRLLKIPGVPTLLLVGLLARMPATATGMALTLHVAEVLDLGYAKAGLVTMASTIGMAIGSPLSGRLVDRHGLRPVLAVTTAAQAAFWSCAWALPFPALAAAAALAGLLALPVFSVTRQCLAAMVPVAQRRTGFTLDSMLVELSYMTGPALAVAGLTALGSHVTMTIIGAGMTLAGIGLLTLNPPTRSPAEREHEAQSGKVARREWLTPAFGGLMATVAAATFVLTATELSLVATMTDAGDTEWVGLAVGIWCVYSLVGGFVYGGLSRGFSPFALIAGMGLLTVPVGLVAGDWRWLVLALLPAGLLCAPALSSTVDVVSGRVPAAARGEAMGLHGTALLIGGAASAPIAGAVIDGVGSSWAFTVAGLAGVAIVLAALPLWRRRRPALGDAVPMSPETASADAGASAASDAPAVSDAPGVLRASAVPPALDSLAVPDGLGVSDGLALPDGLAVSDGLAVPEGLAAPSVLAAPEGLAVPEGLVVPNDLLVQDGLLVPDDLAAASEGLAAPTVPAVPAVPAVPEAPSVPAAPAP